ncbi:MAG: calcium/sodium antiporter [Gemmatimonadota bacterium]
MGELLPRVLLLAGGVGALYFGAEWLIRGAAALAQRFGVPPIVVGLTVVSLGTSAPELAVSIRAALGGASDIAIGNVLGSNLANVGLVLGLTALIQPLTVAARVVQREIPIMIGITLLLYPLILDLEVSRLDGVVLVGLLVAYLLYVMRASKEEPEAVLEEFSEFIEEFPDGKPTTRTTLRDLGLILVGLSALVIGGNAIVASAIYIASALGVSEIVIGMTVVAVGTSLPELATSIVAGVRGEADIAVGNIIGSNIFNIGGVLGVTSIVAPIPVGSDVPHLHLLAVLFLSLLVFPFAKTSYRVQRLEGTLLCLTYVGLGLWIFW